MAHFRVGDQVYDADPTTWQNVEVSAVQRALGCSLGKFMDRLKDMDVDAIQAFIWTLRKRQEPSLRIDAVLFTLREYMADVVMTDQDVRETWPEIESDPDAEDKVKSLAENKAAFLASLEPDQVARLFDADGNLIPEVAPDPLESTPVTATSES